MLMLISQVWLLTQVFLVVCNQSNLTVFLRALDSWIKNSGHHGWTPVRVQRVGTRETEFDAAFLEECEKFTFVNVGGSLRAKVHTHQATFLTPISARTRSKTGNKPP